MNGAQSKESIENINKFVMLASLVLSGGNGRLKKGFVSAQPGTNSIWCPNSYKFSYKLCFEFDI